MKNALFFMVFCLAAFSSAIMASVNKKDIFALFCSDSNYSPMPLTGLAAAPQSSPLPLRARTDSPAPLLPCSPVLLARASSLPIVRGSQRKKRGKTSLSVVLVVQKSCHFSYIHIKINLRLET